MKGVEKEASRNADIETAEAANEKINELREKAIILKNLIIIEKNEEAVCGKGFWGLDFTGFELGELGFRRGIDDLCWVFFLMCF